MFDPHVEDQIWRNQQDYRVLDWKLYDSCRVHSLRKQNVHIHMLVEKRYPLTPATITKWVADTTWDEMLKSAHSALILCLGDRVLREVNKEMTAAGIWTKLETLYMKKYLANRLYLKKKLYTFYMHLGKKQSEHIDEFHKLVDDLAAIDIAISDEDQALLLLTSLPSSYENFVETLLYGRETLKLEDVLDTLNSREVQKMTEAKGDGGKGLYNQKKSQDFVKNKDQVSGSRADGYVLELRRILISLGTLEKEGFTVKMQSGKIKAIKGSLVVLSGTKRANYVYTLDGQAVTRKTLKGRKQLGEYQTGWKIKTGNVLDFCN
ncbi:hypothetical protein Tco_0549549 [Tanacetum coccineum]